MTTPQSDVKSFGLIDGCSLATYAAVCRALVRLPRGTAVQVESTLAAWGLSAEAWTVVRQGWSERIATDSAVRAAFRGLYVGDGLIAPDEDLRR